MCKENTDNLRRASYSFSMKHQENIFSQQIED